MRRFYVLLTLLLLVTTSGLVLSQQSSAQSATPTPTPEIAFAIEGEIGRALPQKIVYDPTFERMAVIDAYNRLLFVNALDYSTISVLHERGSYGDVAFSHDGRWLAVGYNFTMELWDTESVSLVASLTNIGGIRQWVGTIQFTPDDQLLIFEGAYLAPPALRMSEFDTVNYPWVWHLPAARREAESTLPGGIEAIQMFDYRNGFVVTPDNKIVAALPSRLRILDAHTLDTLFEIETGRFEQDPLQVWFSLGDQRLYAFPANRSALLQVNTERGELVEIPMYTDLNPIELVGIGGLELGALSQVIGGTGLTAPNPLLQVLLGRDGYIYDSDWNVLRRHTVTLIDLLQPPNAIRDNVFALLFVFDEESRTGQFRFSVSDAANQMVLSPAQDELLLRRVIDRDEYVVTYDLSGGEETNRFLPALRSIGSFSRVRKNRVLAYNGAGDVIISDFQRISPGSNDVLAEDLRYSRRFDRFFFSDDGTKIITLAGTEWREWDVRTGAVTRREVVSFAGSIAATSTDGYRYLAIGSTDAGGGFAEVLDLTTNDRYRVDFDPIPGSYIENVRANPAWTSFLVVYSVNSYGEYAPGNQIAMYHYQDGFRWLIAGDDLPPIDYRSYGWVDDDTAYVYGEGYTNTQPARVYGVDYTVSGLPACIVEAYPDNVERFTLLWERMVYYLRSDRLHELTNSICANLPGSARAVEAALDFTPTPNFLTPTLVQIGSAPVCLTTRYADQAAEYAQLWEAITAGATREQMAQLETLICEGIGDLYLQGGGSAYLSLTMFLDAETGERAAGNFEPQPPPSRSDITYIQELFELTEDRPLGTAILSRDHRYVAASSLPGELIIYRLITTYDEIMGRVTATAAYFATQDNLIYALPSPSPSYFPIGTARPTLTPTPSQTAYPRASEIAFESQPVEYVCPAEELYPVSQAPLSYDATGQIYAVFGDTPVWVIQPEDGRRYEDLSVPQCQRGVDCNFSPDRTWILARTYDYIYLVRPDGSNQRILWDLNTPFPATPIPYDLGWSGRNVLEWSGNIQVTDVRGTPYYRQGYVQDVLGVYPDPRPYFTDVTINRLAATFVSRQPAGVWAVVYTVYNNGIGEGTKYYLFNMETGAYVQFAENRSGLIDSFWHPYGDRLFYSFPNSDDRYQIVFPEMENQIRGASPGGTWSGDGRLRVYNNDSAAYPVGVWDSVTGRNRVYCLPGTGGQGYSGEFYWSPDDRYVALLMPFPGTEANTTINHTLVLNIETGELVDVGDGAYQLLAWAAEPGAYGDLVVMTPTPPAATVTALP